MKCVHVTHKSFYHMMLVKFNCDVIPRSRLQLITTLTNTFFSKFSAFLAEQRRRMANDGFEKARWHSGRIFSGSTNS